MKKTTLGLSLIIILILIVAFWGISFYSNKHTTTYITLENIPEIKIGLNKKNTVIKSEALNQEGTNLLNKTDILGKGLEESLEIISKEIANIENNKNNEIYILLTIKGNKIENIVSNTINKTFNSMNIKHNIIIPTGSEFTEENARKYNISIGKAGFIEDIIKNHPEYSFENLKNKTIIELIKLNNEKV